MISHSLEETKQIARDFARTLRGGELLLLEGDLGAGKTTFTQGLAEALGADTAHSPTFSIMNVYLTTHPDIRQIVHLDFYRLKSAGEVAQLGLEEWLGRADAVVIVEWPDAVEGLVWDGAVTVRFESVSPTERSITVEPLG